MLLTWIKLDKVKNSKDLLHTLRMKEDMVKMVSIGRGVKMVKICIKKKDAENYLIIMKKII